MRAHRLPQPPPCSRSLRPGPAEPAAVDHRHRRRLDLGAAGHRADRQRRHHRGEDRARAGEANNKAMGIVLLALKNAGIAEKDFQTSRLSLSPQSAAAGRNPLTRRSILSATGRATASR